MSLRRLLSLVLTLGVLALGAPAPADATPAHPCPPADCGSSAPDAAAPGCVNACLSRTLCPPAPAIVGTPAPAVAKPRRSPPAEDPVPGRSLGPEPPPPRT